jgi:hypothetical protein
VELTQTRIVTDGCAFHPACFGWIGLGFLFGPKLDKELAVFDTVRKVACKSTNVFAA